MVLVIIISKKEKYFLKLGAIFLILRYIWIYLLPVELFMNKIIMSKKRIVLIFLGAICLGIYLLKKFFNIDNPFLFTAYIICFIVFLFLINRIKTSQEKK
jgi:hypothetical protein